MKLLAIHFEMVPFFDDLSKSKEMTYIGKFDEIWYETIWNDMNKIWTVL